MFHWRAYASRKFGSKMDRVAPCGGAVRFTPAGGGRPADSRLLPPYAVGLALTLLDCRNGWFCALDELVPPGEKFQNMPKPPRTSVLPSPATS